MILLLNLFSLLLSSSQILSLTLSPSTSSNPLLLPLRMTNMIKMMKKKKGIQNSPSLSPN